MRSRDPVSADDRRTFPATDPFEATDPETDSFPATDPKTIHAEKTIHWEEISRPSFSPRSLKLRESVDVVVETADHHRRLLTTGGGALGAPFSARSSSSSLDSEEVMEVNLERLLEIAVHNEPKVVLYISAQNRVVISNFLRALGLMIGFAWEKCFAEGINNINQLISTTTRDPVVEPRIPDPTDETPQAGVHQTEAFSYKSDLKDFVFTALLLLIILPAWALYIVPTAVRVETDLEIEMLERKERQQALAQERRRQRALADGTLDSALGRDGTLADADLDLGFDDSIGLQPFFKAVGGSKERAQVAKQGSKKSA